METPDIQLNLNVRGLANSATVAINERSNELLKAGREVYKLGLGQSPFPVPDVVVRTLCERAQEKDYLPVRGLSALRDAVADYHHRRHDISRSGADVLIGPGSKELMFILQLVFYGDLVIPTPAWVSYAPQARIIGRPVQMVATRPENHWRLSPEGLERLCRVDSGRPRIVILNYPANPTGSTYAAQELQAIADVARRYRVVMLSDEIYGELHHKGEHVSIARFYPEGTIISSGLSKWCGAGGWRLGTFLFPPSMRWLLESMASVASETFTSTSAPIQYAAVPAFTGCAEIQHYLERSRAILACLGQWAHASLVAAGLRCAYPEGAFYLFPDFGPIAEELKRRNIETSDELCESLLCDTGVAVLPGSAFGRPPHELTCRLAYVDFDGKAALEAFDAVLAAGKRPDEAFLRRHCGRVVTAIERMIAWARGTGSTGTRNAPTSSVIAGARA